MVVIRFEKFNEQRVCVLLSNLWPVCSVYPSFNVDGHKEPSQNDDHNKSLKHTNNK